MIDFREADRRYTDLKRLHDSGEIDTRVCRARLEELSVQDADGRWWAKHRKTGAWHFYDGDDWVPGTPPGYQEDVSEPDPATPQTRTPPSQSPRTEGSAQKRRGALPWVLAVAVVGVVVVGAAVAYLSYFRSGDAAGSGDAGGNRVTATVEVPNVTGKTAAQAEEILRDRGFEVETETRTRPDEDAGKVIGQSPSGEEAKKGSTVEITVGKAAPDEEKPASDEPASDEGPPPGYSSVQDPTGSLTLEVPSNWGVETGEDSEAEGGEFSWSYYAGEYLTSSITTASSLDAWYAQEATGAYVVASENLAREHTDYELTHYLLFMPKSENCTAGPYEDVDRPGYSGKIRTWYDCGVTGMTTFSAVAAPEGRDCVVVLSLRLASEADRDAIEHLLDTFEVDCAKVADA